MAFELTGKLVEKFDTQNVSEKFKKREFVIEFRDNPNSSFTEFIKFQLTQDRCNLIDNFQVGQDLKIWFNLRGRKWEKDGNVSYFTNLEGWKMEASSEQSASAAPLPDTNTQGFDPGDSTNDLPF
ncbi:MAG: DUF3127 domain-containing protein [Lentimicrobium sp.]|jgi:hypothetical protein|nr:DUF3127 domain-containing protein [Lentimicrobium sp.]